MSLTTFVERPDVKEYLRLNVAKPWFEVHAEIKAGIENALWLGTMQIHRENTEDTGEEFMKRFPVGMRLEIVTTTEIKPISKSPDGLDEWRCETGQVQ